MRIDEFGVLVSEIWHDATTGYERIYRIWVDMVRRCVDSNRVGFKDYGGRGIKVCDRWMTFENFANDMGEIPGPRHTIDRVDNSGNYELSNCRWTTYKEQMNNKRNNRILVYKGKSKTVSQWADQLNIPSGRIINRLRAGFETKKALSKDIFFPSGGIKYKAIEKL